MTRRHTHAGIPRTLRIVGYCGLGAIALALFVAMCAILKDSALDREAARQLQNGNVELHGGADAEPGSTNDAAQTRTPG
ncbi:MULTISPECIES: hypothetical protein [Burkholderia]|uniref:Uncharacterized protein n=2 Tax=Burkholderia humptydooensis TaxID=430531 RepID=A0A7U4SUG9_9BURK|nr:MULTISPECIES: hypothetical protein [Burkholderia]AGK51773.1 putative sperm-specific protein Phi-1 [Burkholderia thailandensis MSMB121]ATF33769.1 hypothetical protein CO709_11040 [Burkholderia thailandensis]AJY39630.1 putative sperm-specific protein Phi-1 [Burkholderia sp. 2002721687]ALX44761.1 hypothetical protein AQ610_19590 [Burkholderia humptydooensis]EIP86368.1 hypothetical protein A33K_17458 [Burkholderia humptydooensis MSMB43]